MPKHTEPVKPTTEIALKAEDRLHKTLVRIGNDAVHYLRCFRTGNGRQLALNRVNQGIHVWTEAVWDLAPARFQPMRKRHYPATEPRISTLEANAPRLYKGNAADYWRFPTLGHLEAFVDWYKSL
ncbi:MAG TPA: hypothetical protein VHA71_03360 [Rhodanobacteraceae bacterium]|jgi:hypothetical protein|nr:hypothetical protein [Rhodanobacteraceae bacterium]